MDELGDWVEANKLHICHWFTVNDLNYLKSFNRNNRQEFPCTSLSPIHLPQAPNHQTSAP